MESFLLFIPPQFLNRRLETMVGYIIIILYQTFLDVQKVQCILAQDRTDTESAFIRKLSVLTASGKWQSENF